MNKNKFFRKICNKFYDFGKKLSNESENINEKIFK